MPLKTFQTLTQRAADMYVSLELARSMSLYAAVCGRRPVRYGGRGAVQVADRTIRKAYRPGVHPAARRYRRDGGYPIAHYAARLTAIDQTFGSSTDQLRHLSGQVGDYGVVMPQAVRTLAASRRAPQPRRDPVADALRQRNDLQHLRVSRP